MSLNELLFENKISFFILLFYSNANHGVKCSIHYTVQWATEKSRVAEPRVILKSPFKKVVCSQTVSLLAGLEWAQGV
jgi:hypothetical protein